ncbi:protein-export chaperone SecB [Anaerosalibacter sp. Marseille-P3206]|uniref:protein-export chaperone SecB n=1 Tax=Anaerosalibacter sp. Marseille-P3206 TaxID=1871005 RepID=UPI000987069D|nr:protein-export chaperone SecB [Anaerosalibacter sp. Marseille-P3206]
MKTNKIMADFQFLNNKVIEFSIQNSLSNTKDKVIKVDYDMDYEIVSCNELEDGYLGIVDFIVNLTGKIEESESFKIHLKMRGNFIGSKSKLSIDKFKEMLEVNGTATLSQISRAYITSVTSLSGMPPINLPMVNIYAMMKYKNNSSDNKS